MDKHVVHQMCLAEMEQAQRAHPRWRNKHEALGVITEKFEQFKQTLIQPKPLQQQEPSSRRRAVQLAAMAMRYLVEIEKE